MSETSGKPTVAIIGAGIGGMAAALGLARTGVRPKVYEQAPELGEVGAGISMSPNAMKGLRFLGLEEEVTRLADEPLDQYTRHYRTGEVLVNFDRRNTREEFGAPYLQLHRADLHGALSEELSRLDPDALEVNKTFVGLEQGQDGVELRFADGAVAHADVVVGADGLKSRVRQTVFREDDPEFSGFVAWRGLIPQAEIAHLDLEPGSCVWAGPARIFVRYPVRHGALQNFVAFAKTTQWESESWSQTASTEELLALFSDFEPTVGQLIAALPGGRCHTWGLFARDPLPHWVTGRVTVLGDAAHPMLPWFGQGAASAIEDGVVLARAFAASNDFAEALHRYERARLERVNRIHRESLLGGERLTVPDTDKLRGQAPKTEDTLGITQYDPATVAI